MNIATTEYDEHQDSLIMKSPSFSYWLTHGLIINGGMLLITLILWNKRLTLEKYDELKSLETLKLYLSSLAISFGTSLFLTLLCALHFSSKLSRGEEAKKIMKIIGFGGEYSYSMFIKEYVEPKRSAVESKNEISKNNATLT